MVFCSAPVAVATGTPVAVLSPWEPLNPPSEVRLRLGPPGGSSTDALAAINRLQLGLGLRSADPVYSEVVLTLEFLYRGSE